MANPAPPPAPAPAADVAQQLANDFPRLGMKVRRLLRVIDSHSGGRPALAGLTTDQEKDPVFVPLTAETQLSLCEQLQAENDDGGGRGDAASVNFIFNIPRILYANKKIQNITPARADLGHVSQS